MLPGLSYGGRSLAQYPTVADMLSAERRSRRITVTDGLVRLDGWTQGWEVRSNGKVLARYYGTGSKRRAHLRYRQVAR